jgi:hypothetical protein
MRVVSSRGDVELRGAVIAAGGPFDTEAAARGAAQAAVAVSEGGAWDSAWEKPQ